MGRQISRRVLKALYRRLKKRYEEMIEKRVRIFDKYGYQALRNNPNKYYWAEEIRLFRRIEKVRKKLLGISEQTSVCCNFVFCKSCLRFYHPRNRTPHADFSKCCQHTHQKEIGSVTVFYPSKEALPSCQALKSQPLSL